MQTLRALLSATECQCRFCKDGWRRLIDAHGCLPEDLDQHKEYEFYNVLSSLGLSVVATYFQISQHRNFHKYSKYIVYRKVK